jgi:uncharacterized FAD-dependent dehydrogenase
MTILLREVKVPIGVGQDESALRERLQALLGTSVGASVGNGGPSPAALSISKRSLDARKKSDIHYVYQLRVESPHEDELFERASQAGMRPERAAPLARSHPLEGVRGGIGLAGLASPEDFRHPPVIIGSGPAGIFSALVLAEAGIQCTIVDRGEPVEARMRTVNKLRRLGQLSPESNYCFGEGGAGTFSDGKLTCGRNHPLIRYLFERWVEFGAPESILWEAHPHIGTDNLMRIALRMRQHVAALGSSFLFGTRFVDMEDGGSAARYKLRFANGTTLLTDHVVLAIGHSARDTYQMLLDRGLAMAPKPFALGARIEHSQDRINSIQYGNAVASGASCSLLPAAEYKLAAQAGGRGIWTFCMCPGGFLLPTSAQEGHLAINGMSYQARKSGFANAAVVVNIQREDFFRGHPLDGAVFQSRLEQSAFQAGGGGYVSPAQKLEDFIRGRATRGEMQSTYRPGVAAARLDKLLPSFVTEALQAALKQYNEKMRGYIGSDSIIAGIESKTSSPIVMTRDAGLQSISHPGLFPTGEGAGFAGGIVRLPSMVLRWPVLSWNRCPTAPAQGPI